MEEKTSYIVITGAAGFIGSCVAGYLNGLGYRNLVLADAFGAEEKRRNWEQKAYAHLVERYNLFDWLRGNDVAVDCFIHLGARTDTTEFDYSIHEELNVRYSKDAWNYCREKNVPLVYASSAATYGAGELGYHDSHDITKELQPLNPYGVSKNEFDKWAILQDKEDNAPPCWTGLKFFNVYGPNEYHKGRMASVIWHSFNQVKKTGIVRLFKSHREGFEDGKQLRDFIYVKDVVKVIEWMMRRMTAGDWPKNNNGIYNLGTGRARTFEDLVKATFAALEMEPQITYIDMPEDIRDKYQYFTEADMHKLAQAGYDKPFYPLEDGIRDYVRNYLVNLQVM